MSGLGNREGLNLDLMSLAPDRPRQKVNYGQSENKNLYLLI
jgi:hypothetical protein